MKRRHHPLAFSERLNRHAWFGGAYCHGFDDGAVFGAQRVEGRPWSGECLSWRERGEIRVEAELPEVCPQT